MSVPERMSDEALARLYHGDAEARAELARQAAADDALAARVADWTRQDEALRALYAPVEDEPLTPALRSLLRSAAETAAAPAPVVLPWRQLVAGLALVGVGFAAGWALQGRFGAGTGDALAMGALQSYATYAQETTHAVEIPASEAETLTRWLSKRLGEPVHVPSLQAEGFTLIGGRLLPGAEGPAGLLLYEDDLGRRVAVYVMRSELHQEELKLVEDKGAQAFWWADDGIGCAVAGELPRETLRRLTLAAYQGLTEI